MKIEAFYLNIVRDISYAGRRFLILLYLSSIMMTHALAGERKFILLHEPELRRRATKIVMPEYPEVSKKRGATGVSVSRIDIDEDGNVINVEVLQAPDEHIEAALLKAISQWKFQPFTHDGQPRAVKGKLIFYFLKEGAKTYVKSPRFHANQN